MKYIERLERLDEIIDNAAAMALDWSGRRRQLTVDEKPGRQFASAADLDVEHAIRADIARWFPDDAILGEEHGGTLSGLTWVLDPIDGTSNFLSGLPLWGISIALMEERRPVLGAIALPVLGLCLIGAPGLGLLPPRQGPVPVPPVPTIALGWNAGLPETVERRQTDAIRAAGFEVVGYRCASASLYLVVTGALSGYCERGLSLWDWAAGAALCEAAGIPYEVEWPVDEMPFVFLAGAATGIKALRS